MSGRGPVRLALVAAGWILIATPLAGAAPSRLGVLAIDPFAEAPLRVLSGNANGVRRRALAAEIRREGTFAAQVVAARLALEAGRAAEAREDLRLAAGGLSDQPRVLDAFAQLALEAGAFVEAAGAATRAIGVAPTAARLVLLARAELRLGKQKEALAHAEEAVRRDPRADEVIGAAVDALQVSRLYADAARLLRVQVERAGAVPGAATWRKLGELYRKAGDDRGARTALLRALDVEPTPTGRRALTDTLTRLTSRSQARAALLAEVCRARSVPRLLLCGDLELARKRSDAARAAYQKASALAPMDEEPQLRLTRVETRPAARIAGYEKLMTQHPDDPRFVYALAELRFQSKDKAGAAKILTAAGERFATAVAVQDRLAELAARQGQDALALALRAQAAQLDPRDPERTFALGEAQRALGRKAEALETYRRFLRLANGEKSAYERLLEITGNKGYEDEEQRLFEEAVRRWPGDLALRRRAAGRLERRGELKRAVELWRDVERIAPTRFEVEQASFHVKKLEGRLLLGR